MDKKETKKEDTETNEEMKKDIAKQFGLSLEDIQHIILDNGHEIYKFRNPKDGSIKMIENIDHSSNMNEQFKNSQNNLSFAKGDDAKENAEDIYNYNLQHKNMEVPLITISEFKSNRYKYSRILRGLSTKIRTQVKYLLRNSEILELHYINLDYGIGINDEGEVIDVKVDFANKHISLQSPKVISYENKELSETMDNEVIDLSDEELEAIFNDIIITDDIPTITEVKEIKIGGESINTQTIIDAYNMPESIDRMNINEKQRSIYRRIVDAIARRLGINNTQRNNNRQYVYQRNDENRAA